jgi:hypothetical protein
VRLFFGWRHFSKNPARALSTKVVDKFVDSGRKCDAFIPTAWLALVAMKCSADFSGMETAPYR